MHKSDWITLTGIIVLSLLTAFMIYGIAVSETSTYERSPKPTPTPYSTPSSNTGIGITITGKPGIGVCPGIVMGMDGEISPGFTF